MTSGTSDVVELLKEDHEKVKQLFKRFESAGEIDQTEETADQIDLALRVHLMIDEEILYTAFKDDSELTTESVAAHGIVDELLNELARWTSVNASKEQLRKGAAGEIENQNKPIQENDPFKGETEAEGTSGGENKTGIAGRPPAAKDDPAQ